MTSVERCRDSSATSWTPLMCPADIGQFPFVLSLHPPRRPLNFIATRFESRPPSQLHQAASLWRLICTVHTLTCRRARRWASHRHECLDERRCRRSKSQWRRFQPSRFSPIWRHARPFSLYEQLEFLRSLVSIPKSATPAAHAEWQHAKWRWVPGLQQSSIPDQPSNTFEATQTPRR